MIQAATAGLDHVTPPADPACARYRRLRGGATILAFGLAFLGLYRRRLPRIVSVIARRALAPPVHILRGFHSGVVGDYVTWVAVGTAVVGGAFALLLHG